MSGHLITIPTAILFKRIQRPGNALPLHPIAATMAPSRKRRAKVVEPATLELSDSSEEKTSTVPLTPKKPTPRAKNKRKLVEIDAGSGDEKPLADVVPSMKKSKPVASDEDENKHKEIEIDSLSDEKPLADVVPSLKRPEPVASDRGGQDADPDTLDTSTQGKRLKRVRKASAKALYMSDTQAPDSAIEPSVATTKKPMFVTNEVSELFPAVQTAYTSRFKVPNDFKQEKVSESPDSSDVEVVNPLSLSDLPPATPPKSAAKGKQRLFVADSDLEPARNSASDTDDDSELHSNHSLSMKAKAKQTGTNMPRNDNKPTLVTLDSIPPIPDTGITRIKAVVNNPLVIDPVLIDPLLAGDYPGLPVLRNSQLVPYGKYATNDQYMISYTQLYTSLRNDRSQGLLQAAVRFTSALPFINPSRGDPNRVSIENSRICLPDPTTRNKLAVFLTTGLLVESSLNTPAVCTTNVGAEYKVKQVLLSPLSGEFERAAAYFGTAYGVDSYSCQMEDSCLFFTTRREGAGADSNFSGILNSPGSPVRSRKVASGLQVLSPVKRSTKAAFPASLGFKDTVPIYDARSSPGFTFSPDDLQNLAKLPVYRNRDGDTDILGNKYIATVGYTVSSWNTPGNTRAIGMNVQFIILLAKKHSVV